MKYASPSDFQGLQLSGYLPNNHLSVCHVYHRKLLLPKDLYGAYRALHCRSVPCTAGSLWGAPELLLLHTTSSSPHQVSSHLCTARSQSPTWTGTRKSHGLGGKPCKPKSCPATGQKSLCWDFCKLRKACLPPCSVCPCSHIPHLKRRALGILQGGTSLCLPGEGMAPWSGWRMPVEHKAGFKVSLRPSSFTNIITVSMNIFYLADDTRTQLFLKAFSEAFIFSLCFSHKSSALKTERIAQGDSHPGFSQSMKPCALTDTLYLKQTSPSELLEEKNWIAENGKPKLIAPLDSIIMDSSPTDPPLRALTYLTRHWAASPPRGWYNFVHIAQLCVHYPYWDHISL